MYFVSKSIEGFVYVTDTSDGVVEKYDFPTLEALIKKYNVEVYGLWLSASGKIRGAFEYTNPSELGNTLNEYSYADTEVRGNGNDFALELLYLDFKKGFAVFGVNKQISAEEFIDLNARTGIKVISEGMLGTEIKPEIFIRLGKNVLNDIASSYRQVLAAARNKYKFEKGQMYRNIRIVGIDEDWIQLQGVVGRLTFNMLQWNTTIIPNPDIDYVIQRK